MVECPNWKELPEARNYGLCVLGLFGGKPLVETCIKKCLPRRAGIVTGGIERSPCPGCGDKTNIAQLKSDPAAMDRMLAGE